MAEVRLRLDPGAGSLWTPTRFFLLRLVSRKGGPKIVDAVSRTLHSRSASSHRCVNVWRSYRTSGSTEETPLYRSKSAYYDILQVSPKATQAQIKTAYYKQSFIYHPDKNAGSELAATRFSQISEAYNVLGNRTLRKKYDGGILSEAEIRGFCRPTATKDGTSGSASDAARNRPSAGAGARSQNDFDAFYRAHYGEQLQRQKHIRARLQEIQRRKENAFQGRKLGRMSEVAVGVMLVVAGAIVFSLKSTKG